MSQLPRSPAGQRAEAKREAREVAAERVAEEAYEGGPLVQTVEATVEVMAAR